MTQRPVIGLPGKRRFGRDLVDAPEVLGPLPVDVYMADYAAGVYEAGGLPVHLPFGIDMSEMIQILDGILLPGGTDISPDAYGAESETDLFGPEPDRDRQEIQLLDAAAETDVPILGICRGIQILNVHGGGALEQHVPQHARFDSDPSLTVHDVDFSEGSIIHGLYGSKRAVNSFHHQTLSALAPDYLITGTADDGRIEAIEHTRRNWIGVQWHPEMMTGRPSDPVFRWLVDRAAERAARKA